MRRALRRSGVAWLALLAAVAARADEPRLLLRDVRSQDPAAQDLVFLPDGFRAGEEGAFLESVRAQVRALEEHPASFVQAARSSWNVHAAWLPSEGPCPARPGQPAGRTAFRTRVLPAAEGGLYASDDAAIDAAARRVAAGVDCVVVVLRCAEARTSATADLPGEGARVRIPEGMEHVILHELAHALYGLGDEYAGRAEELPASEQAAVAFYPNLTCDPSGARFVGLGVRSPTLREGGADHARGVWRQRGPCVMENPGAERFCAVCAAVIAAGRAGNAVAPPGLGLEQARRGVVLELTPAADAGLLVRSFTLLVRADEAGDDAALLERFRSAQARASSKTRYTVSPWLGEGAGPGERVFSREGHARRIELGALEDGGWALVAASAGTSALSRPALLRFTVEGGRARATAGITGTLGR